MKNMVNMKNKRIVVLIIAALILALTLVGCNYDLIDTQYHYDRAVFEMANGEVIDGKVESWRDYDDGDQIQVKVNGKVYLVHSSNITLIAG